MGLPWIEMSTDLPEHPKSLALAANLGDDRAWTYMAQVWLWCAKVNPSGRFVGRHAKAMLERAAGWRGVPGEFAEAALEAGFVDQDGDALIAHGWEERATAHLAKLERDAERQKARRERIAKRFAPKVTEPSTGHPADVRVTSTVTPPGTVTPTPTVTPTQTKDVVVVPATSDPISAMSAIRAPPELDRRGETPDRRHAVPLFEKPKAPPEEWLAEDFYAWAQWKRQKAGLPPEQRRPRELGSWYSGALMLTGGAVQPLKEAFYGFGDDDYWKNAKPPLPFAGFIDQWTKWLPRGAVRNAGA